MYSPHRNALGLALAIALSGLACQHRRAPMSEPLSVEKNAPQKASVETESGGYFFALSAQASTSGDALALYDGVHDAIDKLNRKRLAAQGELEGYLEAYEADGYSRLAAGDDEIECDREKCLMKLTGRILTGSGSEDESMASLMTEALVLKGLKPEIRGTGESQLKTYVLGKQPGSFISCVQRGFGKAALYRCEFALDKGFDTPANATVESTGRGKLVSCSLSPGTVRTADEAKREIDGGGLLNLTSGSGSGAKSVGYLRYVKQGREVEFLDLFLCGDVSHDYFHIEGKARNPSAWLAAGPLESLTQDDARMVASPKVVEESPRIVTLEVRFKLGKESEASEEVYGDDEFFVKLDRTWVK